MSNCNYKTIQTKDTDKDKDISDSKIDYCCRHCKKECEIGYACVFCKQMILCGKCRIAWLLNSQSPHNLDVEMTDSKYSKFGHLLHQYYYNREMHMRFKQTYKKFCINVCQFYLDNRSHGKGALFYDVI